MNAEDLGSATPLDDGIITVGDFAIARDKAFFTTHALVTRGTTCWAARPLVGGKNKTAPPMPWILKVAWRYPARKHEGTTPSECQALKVQGMADYIAHDEGREPITVHGILGKRCVESAVALDLRWKRNKRPSPHPAPASRPNKKSKRSGTHDVSEAPASDRSHPELLTLSLSTVEHEIAGDYVPVEKVIGIDAENAGGQGTAAEAPMPDRIFTRVLMSRGKPIDEFTDPVELLLAIHDAIHGHRSLLIDGHILHRDISVNNITITIPSQSPRTDLFHGFLIDLDHAISADAIGQHSSVPERTGTFEFMSIDALLRNPSFRHIYCGGLQSFMGLFLAHYQRPLQESCTRGLDKPEVTGAIKALQIEGEENFEVRLARWFDKDLGAAVSMAAKDVRSALHPAGGRKELEREEVRDRLYERVIKAFDDALVVGRR